MGLFIAKPLVIDAENESIAKAIAMSIIVISKVDPHFMDYSQNYFEREKVSCQCNYFVFQFKAIHNFLKWHEFRTKPSANY